MIKGSMNESEIVYNACKLSIYVIRFLFQSLALPSLPYCLVKLHSLLEVEAVLICVRVWLEGVELGDVVVATTCFPREEGEVVF